MKAIVQNAYGSPDLLELAEVERPAVGDSDVLVRVRAASVHSGDYFMLKGEPYLARLVAGWPKPKNYVPGFDVAGTVESIGKSVTLFQPGDEVFGECGGGACAEFACADESRFVTKPAELTFEQVAVVPISALAALQGLRDAGNVRPGQRVLINGASGGVGVYAVQIAKSLGAEVTGVCGASNVELVRSLGADHVIDYTSEDFTRNGQSYDVILDNVASRTFAEYRRALAPEGRVVPNSGNAGISYMIKAYVRSLYAHQQGRPFLSGPTQADLLTLKGMLENGQLKPVIGATFLLADTAEALRLIGTGHSRGKVLITV